MLSTLARGSFDSYNRFGLVVRPGIYNWTRIPLKSNSVTHWKPYISNSSLYASKRPRKPLKWLFLSPLLVLVAVGVVLKIWSPRYSMVFLGEDKEFEEKMEKEFSFPPGLLLKIFVTHLGIELGLDMRLSVERFIKDFPNIAIGYLMLANLERISGNPEKALAAIHSAQVTADQHPDKNHLFRSIISSAKEDQISGKSKMETIFTEIIPGKIWTLCAPYRISPNHDFTQVQSSIVRRNDGTLVIINPTNFTGDCVHRINDLGIVSALVTPTASHGELLALATKIWPHALVYGTDPSRKHDQPSLPWTFLKEEQQIFGPDLQFFPLKGHVLKEFVFYHPETKCIMGLTDIVLSVSNFYSSTSSTSGKVFAIGSGLYRGSDTKILECQNYHYFFTYNKRALGEGFRRILNLHPDYVILGHGGILKGPETGALEKAVSWAVNPNNEYSFFEQIFIPLKFIYISNFGTLFWGKIKKIRSQK